MSRTRKPVEVLVVTHTGEVGGAESALIRLVGALDPFAFRVRVLTLSPGPLLERLESAGIASALLDAGDLARVTRADTVARGRGALRNVRSTFAVAGRLRRVLRAERPGLVVANSLKAAVVVGLVAPAIRVPWVWHLHDRLAADYLPAAVVASLRLWARAGPRRIVANSEATARTLGRRRRGQVVVAYPGLEPAAFAPARPARRGPIGILGRVSDTKGQREFLDAAELVVAHRSARFRIIGGALFEDAPVEAELRARTAASTVLSRRVRWTGWVDDAPRRLRRLRLLVHASPVPEPFGQVVTEAMAAGVPVIATDAGGVPEILDPSGAAVSVAEGVRRGSAGLLVRAGDPRALAAGIEWALDHPRERDDMVTRARALAEERFTIRHTAEIVSAVWASSVKSR